MSNKSVGSKSATKVVEKSESSQPKPHLFLDQLALDVTGTIVVMIGRVWDVNAITGRYLSTDLLSLTQRGQSLRVTLWGGLGDVLVERKTKHKLNTENSSVEPTKAALAADCSQPKEGTLKNLLIWARNRKNNVCMFSPVLAKYFVTLPCRLLTCSADLLLMGADDEGADADDDLNLPTAIRNLIGKTHPVEDGASSSTPTLTADDAVPSMKRLSRHPTVCTPSKPNEEKKKKVSTSLIAIQNKEKHFFGQ
ncbi:hypothetical protein Tco_1578390 [Tanacetum coccineum]